jgi:hypothetical protein
MAVSETENSTSLSPQSSVLSTSLRAIAKPGIEAVRRMWLPFVLIQLCAVAVVAAYFKVDAFREFCERLARIKEAGGLPFSATVMAIVSGVLPEIFKVITGADNKPPGQRFRDLVFNTLLFSVSGVLSDLFYRLLAVMFPPPTTVWTVTAKLLIDMLVYGPVIGFTWMPFCYTIREHRYRVGAAIKSLGVAWYLSRAAPVMLPGWAYWTPMCVLMYMLPPSLTFIFAACANAAAATILITVAARKTQKQEERHPPAATSGPTTRPSGQHA